MNSKRLASLARGLGLGMALAAATTQAGLATGTLDIHWVDVEGGAATLIVTPAGESILVDTGMPGERDPARIVKVAREQAGVERIDHLVITHFHIDHFGGAAQVAAKLPVGTLRDNGVPDHDPDGNADSRRFLDWIRPYKALKADAKVVMNPGDLIPLRQKEGSPALSLKVVGTRQSFPGKPGAAPGVDCGDHKTKSPDTSDNANSVVLLLRFGEFDFFIGGDLTWNVEAALACPANLVGEIDVFQVNHHGLDQSNNPLLVKALAPRVAVMSNGISKGCGPETAATLRSTPSIAAVFQMHKSLREDAGVVNTAASRIANLEKDCQANSIKLTVAADSLGYEVSIPATRHSERFETKR